MSTLEDLTQDEWKQLALNWLWMHGHGTVSHSRYRNGDRSWAPFLKKFNEQRREQFKDAAPLKKATFLLRMAALDFSAVYNKVKKISLSLGKSSTDAELVEVAKEDYYRQHGQPFIFESAWYLFRDHPEWANSGTEETNQSNKTSQQRRTRSDAPSGSRSERLATSTPKTRPSSRERDRAKLEEEKSANCSDDEERQPIVKKKVILNEKNQPKILTTYDEVQIESQPPYSEATSVTKPAKLVTSTHKTNPSSRKREHDKRDEKESPNCSDDQDKQPIVKKRMILDNKKQVKVSTTYDEVQIETLKINRLQLEVKRLEAETEYERIQLDIMEKDLSSCTDEYEQEFFLFKKRKIIAALKSQDPDPNSTNTTKDFLSVQIDTNLKDNPLTKTRNNFFSTSNSP
ncbi:hypothetical protein MJO28_002994 [Puccinia striiformis f. sp. tritici]|nr:hypothetical protein MJO28_002994 [Puccinia striiformis f. sp. tritici]KAI9620009.1 hypothetical protein H4Q26_013991 [Puccinia striiformis f. sp. tritici PST-130]